MSDRLVLLREKKEDEKLAPQAQLIYDMLKERGVNKELDREAFVQAFGAHPKLTTRQDPARVFGYYLQQFVKSELVKVIKAEPAPKAEKKADKSADGKAKDDKPAKSPADATADKKPENKAA
jgi:hypothetical protein